MGKFKLSFFIFLILSTVGCGVDFKKNDEPKKRYLSPAEDLLKKGISDEERAELKRIQNFKETSYNRSRKRGN